MDDGNHTEPTYANIIGAFKKLVSESEAGDCAFVHYSGESKVVVHCRRSYFVLFF